MRGDGDGGALGIAFLAAAVGAAAYFLLPGTARADTSVADQDTSDTGDAAGDEDDYVPWESGWPGDTDAGGYASSSGDMNTDARALLFTVKTCEHTYPDAVSGACYGIFYAGRPGFNPPELLNQTFDDFSDHPVITGACQPVPLPDAVCRAAGLGEGCVTTAAGAYQIIRPTWLRAQRALGLPDFSPASQDAAAVWLLQDCGAMAKLVAGDVEGAIKKASKVWASLPGATTKQGPKSMEYALARFAEGQAQA